MPNHISNRLTLRCTDEQAATVLAAVAKKNEDGTTSLIDFNTLIPYPEHFANADRESEEWRKANPEAPWAEQPKDGFNHGGYEWCLENWGTKWNAYDQKQLSPTVIYFETAWSAPVPVVDTLAAKFPGVPLTLEYADEDIGNNAGVIRYDAGTKVHEELSDAEAIRLWFDLNPGCDPKELGFDPVTFSRQPQDEDSAS